MMLTNCLHSVIFPRGVVHRVGNGWGLTKVAAVLLNGLLCRDKRDGHLLFEVEMYLQKGCIMVSGVGSS